MKFLIYILFLIPAYIPAQFEVQNIGLKNTSITSLKINYGIIAVATNQNGVFWTSANSDSINWQHINLDKKNILTVYPHKSGPLGWAIGSGIQPDSSDTNFIYCSFLGGDPKPISYGIDPDYTFQITKLDGFPDPTICGETFAAGGRILYRRYFTDSVWHPVYILTIEGHFATVKANQSNGIVMAGGGEGFANHLLVKSFDKGDSWKLMSPLISVQNIDFSDDDSAKTIFVSDQNKILQSDDYGDTWNEIFQSIEFIISQIYYNPGQKNIYFGGIADRAHLGKVLYKNINDEFWSLVPINFVSPVVDIDGGKDYNSWIYVATADSGVFRFRYISPNDINDELEKVPNKIQLFQNYPNPFNPTTAIEYTIPGDLRYEIQEVRLIIYDILGRKVETLVNQKQKPGFYKVEFSGNNLPSGIYYYQLNYADFLMTKKMIILK